MQTKLFTYWILLLYLISNQAIAQDPVYSQYYNAPTSLNPAFTGNFDAPVIAINYRNQWPAINNAYSTYSVSYDQYFRKYKSGLGISLLSDSAGDGVLKTNNINLDYSYRLKMNDDYRIKLGIETSFFQTQLNWEKLIFADNLDPYYGKTSPGGTPYPSSEIKPKELSKSNIDISTGLLLYSRFFYVGLTLKHLNNPKFSFLKSPDLQQDTGLPMRFSIHSGYTYTIRDSYKHKEGSFLSPSFLLTKQGDFLQINTGVYAQLRQFITGIWGRYAYSNFDAIIVAAGWKYDIYKIVYSFDIPVSKIGISSGGSHELGIIINFDKIYPDKSRSIECFEVLR